MKTKKITLEGIEFYADRYSGALVAYDKIEGVDDINDAKRRLEALLCSYIKEYPYLGLWSITVETNDGHTVEMSWECNSVEEYDEFITTFVDHDRLYDNNQSNYLIEAYEIGDAKWTLASTDEEIGEICKAWFKSHVEEVIERYPEEFTDEEKARAEEVKPLLAEY